MPLEDQQNFRSLSKIFAEKTKRLVVFCGAGASLEAKLPTWDGLVESLESEYFSIAHSAIGEKITEEYRSRISGMPDNWHRVSLLKELMQAQYEIVVRQTLTPSTAQTPTFYKRVWDLDPHALLTFNLDGFSTSSYANQKTGKVPNHLIGKQAHENRFSLGDGRPLIVDLHGHVGNPGSWVLTKEDIDQLLNNPGYLEFLRSMFVHNLVIFYGVGVADLAVTGQLSYLANLRVGLEKPSTISIPCKPSGDQANVGDHDPCL